MIFMIEADLKRMLRNCYNLDTSDIFDTFERIIFLKTPMQIPTNAVRYETPLSTFWIDENGILCSIAKKDVPQTIENLEKNFVLLNQLANGKKLCCLHDISQATAPDKASRDYIAKEAVDNTKAVALLSPTVFSAVIANLFINLTEHPFPSKMFTDADRAKEWLKQYL